MAFSWAVQCNSNTYAEALAARCGVQLCIDNQMESFNVELDSSVIPKMLINKEMTNMKLKKLILEITDLCKNATVKIFHCYREDNQVPNLLAKLASSSGDKTFYTSHQQLPREDKGLIQLDKWQLPSFRRRYDKE